MIPFPWSRPDLDEAFRVLEALEDARLAMRETGLAPRLQEVRWRWWTSTLARRSRRAGFVADRPGVT
jgi:hypothetical protein